MPTLKTCFKCGETKERTEFYKHKMMGDGLLGKCKECTKADVRAHRAANDSVREYDRKRSKLPARREYDRQRAQLPARKMAHLLAVKKWRTAYPERMRAHTILNNAVRAGVVKKQPCHICGSDRGEAHHPDYSSPLDVVWLCPLHHKLAHAEVA